MSIHFYDGIFEIGLVVWMFLLDERNRRYVFISNNLEITAEENSIDLPEKMWY